MTRQRFGVALASRPDGVFTISGSPVGLPKFLHFIGVFNQNVGFRRGISSGKIHLTKLPCLRDRLPFSSDKGNILFDLYLAFKLAILTHLQNNWDLSPKPAFVANRQGNSWQVFGLTN